MQNPLDREPNRRRPNISSQLRLIGLSAVAMLVALAIFFGLNLQDVDESIAGNITGVEDSAETYQIKGDYVPGRLILRIRNAYRSQCTANAINVPGLDTQLAQLGVSKTRKNFPQAEVVPPHTFNALGQQMADLSLVYELELDLNSSLSEAIVALRDHPAVEYVEPRYIYEVFYTPDDPFTQYQWYLDTIHAYDAWNQTQGDTNVVIGIIDTGTSFAHEELGGNRVYYNYNDPIDGTDNDNDGFIDNFKGWDFGGASFFGGPDNDPTFVGTGPGMDHGVLVTGPASAEFNNGKGIAGIGLNTRYLPLKASIDQSTGISYGMDAIVYAADRGTNIINLSWGSTAASSYGQDIMTYAAVNKGCLLVAAAGNQHVEQFIYPASYQHVISVAGTEANDLAWDYGNGTGTSFNFLVDISAPARNIMTTAGATGYWSGSTGTSMASPIVCAAAAIVKAKYPTLNNIQAGEVVRVTGSDINGPNPTLADKMGLGRVNLENAVTQASLKSVRIDSIAISDGIDDLANPLDTVDIMGNFINYLDPLQALNITVSSANPDLVEVVQGNANIGGVATLSNFANPSPFRIYVKEDVHTPTTVYLRFGFVDGNYVDYEYKALTIYPTAIQLDANEMVTSINGTGNYGFSDFPSNLTGLGVKYLNKSNIITDGGFLVGISGSKLVDGIRNETGFHNYDFAPTQRPIRTVPGPQANLEASTRFDDRNAGTYKIGLEVDHHAWQYTSAGDDEFIIMEYVIRNENNYPINDAYAGMYAHWNQWGWTISEGNYYSASNAVAAHFNSMEGQFYAGISLLTDQSVNAMTTTDASFDFRKQSKFDALRATATAQSNQSGSVLEFISAGPFNIAAGDSVVVAFALVAASSKTILTDRYNAARSKYHCAIKQRYPTASLGADLSVCDLAGPAQLTGPTGSGYSYLWSTGETTADIFAPATGDYSLTVTNAYGCSAADTVHVNVVSMSNHNISIANQTILTNTPVVFEVTDPQMDLISWQWDFGDGATSNQSAPTHMYTTAGFYDVKVIISNGQCTDTLRQRISVETATSLNTGFASGLQLYPNPVENQLNVRLENDFNGALSLRIYDAGGRLVRQRDMEKLAFSHKEQVATGDLAAGTYVVHLINGRETHTQKIIKR